MADIPVERGHSLPVGPGTQSSSSFNPKVIDFGHYAGHSIEELAQTDPDYLRWLARHASGGRYRSEIERALGINLRGSY